MLTLGDTFPDFDLAAVQNGDVPGSFSNVRLADHAGHWLVVFFWPKDFTFVCPTEIAEFGDLTPEFSALDASVLGVSTDSEFVHLAWRESHPALRQLPFPMVSDIKRELSNALGIIDREAGVALRATFIVDPSGIIKFVSVNDLDTGRNPAEVVRVLAALQAGGLTACGWNPGDALLTPA